LMRFKHKVVVVTGGANGIGKAIVDALLLQGAYVVCVDNGVIEPSWRLRSRLYVLLADIRGRDDCKEAAGYATKLLDGIDILINNAGIQPIESYRPVHEFDEEVWDRVMDVNLKGYFLMAKYCLPHMVQQRRGVIINIASVTAHAASKNISAYAASKAGIISLTRSIALEYAEYGIRAVAVCPGAIDTERLRSTLTAQTHGKPPAEALERLGAAHPLGRIGTPEEVASLVLYLASDDASFITGSCFDVDGGGLSKGYYSVG
jgi:NAD(P)-dependent dehydrogenase (short-subunit alcohol dehydrogenase family)